MQNKKKEIEKTEKNEISIKKRGISIIWHSLSLDTHKSGLWLKKKFMKTLLKPTMRS